MPFFNLNEMEGAVVAPGHSTAHGPTVRGNELELGYYTEPKDTGANPHKHKSEQIMMVLSGKLRMRIDDETRDIGPGEVAIMTSDQEHEQFALEEGTRFVSFKTVDGALPEDE